MHNNVFDIKLFSIPVVFLQVHQRMQMFSILLNNQRKSEISAH